MVKKYLYNKKTPVLMFEEDESGQIILVEGVGHDDLLPICLRNDISLDAFLMWMKKRKIPKTREGLGKVCHLYGDILNKDQNLFSLTDQYWVKTKNENWDKLNFFKNSYTYNVGNMFFAPWEVEPCSIIDYHTPDLTTNGILKKTWIKNNDGADYLLKASSPATHQEPLNEVLASIVMEKLNIIPFVRYDLCVHGLEICSSCANFVDENTEFVPAIHIYSHENRADTESVYTHLLRMCDEFEIDGAKDFIDKMIFIDYLIGNEDRHLGNFGFLRIVDGPDKGKIKMAPLFDSGSAFWNTAPDQRRKVFDDVEKKIVKKQKNKYDLRQFAIDFGYIDFISSYPNISTKSKDRTIKKVREHMRELNQREIEFAR